MNKNKRSCKCPAKLQHICKLPKEKTTDVKNVAEIIEALTFEDFTAVAKRKKLLSKPPNFKTKQFKPPHFKDTCVPMKPSMHTRLRYIGHCPIEALYPDNRARNAAKKLGN